MGFLKPCKYKGIHCNDGSCSNILCTVHQIHDKAIDIIGKGVINMEEHVYLIMKRDGTTEPINIDKLKNAILKAITSSYTIQELRSFKPNVTKISNDVTNNIKEFLDIQIDHINRNEATIAITMVETIVNRVLTESGFTNPDIKLEYK